MRNPLAGFAATLLLTAAVGLGADAPVASTPESEGFSGQRLQLLHESLDRLVASGEYAGYVDLVARDGNVVDFHSGGMRDLAAHTPMTPDTIVHIHSMTKLVTTVGFMKLVEDGRVQLSDPVEKYLPALAHRKVFKGGTVDAPELEAADHPMTVKELLNHTAGYYYPETWSADPVPRMLMERAKIWESSDLDDFVRRIATLPLHQQPGTRFRYGIHLDLLGAIIEKVTGQRLDRYLQQAVFDPLRMTDTGFWVPAGKRDRLAIQYQRESGILKPMPNLIPEPGPGFGFLSGGGGLYSTASDYARFAQMMLNGGSLDGVRILGRKTVELMTTDSLVGLADPHPFGQKELGFGLGVRIMTTLGLSRHLGSPGMFGWDGATTTLYWIDPKERMVSILLTQHVPYNEDDIFATFMNGVYSSLER
jgi:CubicO group peptidase (beta-lactamase class C family)